MIHFEKAEHSDTVHAGGSDQTAASAGERWKASMARACTLAPSEKVSMLQSTWVSARPIVDVSGVYSRGAALSAPSVARGVSDVENHYEQTNTLGLVDPDAASAPGRLYDDGHWNRLDSCGYRCRSRQLEELQWGDWNHGRSLTDGKSEQRG
jgi:hypothetical protein